MKNDIFSSELPTEVQEELYAFTERRLREEGHVRFPEYLLSQGADVRAKNNEGETATADVQFGEDGKPIEEENFGDNVIIVA